MRSDAFPFLTANIIPNLRTKRGKIREKRKENVSPEVSQSGGGRRRTRRERKRYKDFVPHAGKKRKGRKPKIKLDIQEAVWNIHERAGKLQSVRNMHPKGIATKENEFRYAKRELQTYDILTFAQYDKVLKARIKHHSNQSCKRIQNDRSIR